MISKKLKSVLSFLGISLVFLAVLSGFTVLLYLKGLPYAVKNPKVINYFRNFIKDSYSLDVDIENPELKTEFSPNINFSVDKVCVTSGKKRVLEFDGLDVNLSFAEVFDKNIVLNKAVLGYFYTDINKVLDLPFLKQDTNKPQQKSDWNVDVFRSVLALDKADIVYMPDKKTKLTLNAAGIKIDDNPDKKHINYNIAVNITKGSSKLQIKTSDDNRVFIENKEKAVIDNTKIFVNDSEINLKGFADNKANFDVELSSKGFSIPAVLNLLDSQIVENNLTEQLVYFKDIDGSFDFKVKAANNALNGEVNLNKLAFKLIPIADLPILLNHGKVTFDESKIYLKDFKGYYNNKLSNSMDFEGNVDDYLKSVDANLEGNAIVTNDFARNYLSKMAGYPIGIEGKAETKVKLHSINNKIDLKWLYWFKKGSGFVFDGEESTMNDAASRVLSAKIHFEDMLLKLESLNYYAGNPEDDMKQVRIPIISAHGDFDLSNGQTFVKRFGMELPKPMPSGFINMLVKQKLFKGGTFTGYFDLLNKKGFPPKIKANMKVEELRIPSQRLYIKSGEFKTDRNNMHVSSNGKYRRSAYDLSGTIANEIRFPIVVKNITLGVDKVDIEKYLKLFNEQQPTVAAADINTVISDSVVNNVEADENDDDTVQTFDLANLIIEECILKVKEGHYKGINFSDVNANLTLDKNSRLKITSNLFDIAEGKSNAKIDCDLREHKYNIRLGIKEVNSDIIATNLLNLSKEIQGKASGLIELNTDDSLKLNGRIQFRVYEGIIGKVGLVEYIMKVALLFRNPLTMVSPSVISDLVSVPEGKFNQIDGDLVLKDNVVIPMKIKSVAPQLSSYIVGTYNLEKQDAALRIYTKFSNRKKGLYGLFRNFSLNSLANRMPLGSRSDEDYYASELSQLPDIEADEKDCQIFLTKVDGDVEHNNFISSLKKIK
ncbi:MAG: hypothetical protein NC191_07605 [Muribaculaceae bacterium]|nr:hypothetical protein [Muribaculaceae bacterium]